MPISKSDLKRLKTASEEAAEAEDEEALTKLVLEGMRAADTASQLWSVATTGAFNEAALGEDVFPAAVLDLVIERAATFTKPTDRAHALSLAARITAFSPVALIEQEPSSRQDKPSLLEALKVHRDWLRLELASPKPVLRAAAALALGRCGDDGDAILLLADLGSESEAGARLMAAAALGADVTGHARGFLSSDDQVARTCAACALGLAPEPIGEDVCAVLAEAIVSAHKLPPAWGWRGRLGDAANTAAMACAVLRNSEVENPAVLVNALSAMDELDQMAADTLGRLAFPTPFKPGVALEDLDEVSQDALRVLSRVPRYVQVRSTLNRLGLNRVEDIAAFFERTPPFFSVAVIDVGGKTRGWHVARVWRERLLDGIGHQTALEGIAAALSDAEIYEALIVRHRAHIGFSVRDPQQDERSLELAVGLFAHLQKTEFPLREGLIEGFERGGRGLHGLHLAIGALIEFGADLPDSFDVTLAKGLVLTKVNEPVGRLLGVLDEDRRRAIEADVGSKRV